LAQCREVMFITDGVGVPFITQICHDSDRWHWAAAEPAVDRWGTLQ
jgi:hypothetical protein